MAGEKTNEKAGEISSESNTTGYKNPTPKDIEKYKEKYPDLFKVSVIGRDGKVYVAILRQPKIADMQIAAASETKKKGTYNQSIWANCKVVGDPAIEQDDFLFMGGLSQLDTVCAFAEANVEKL